jgi:hypothetical protein
MHVGALNSAPPPTSTTFASFRIRHPYPTTLFASTSHHSVATCSKPLLRRPLCIAPQSHYSIIAAVFLYIVRDKSSVRMESKRKANGHAAAAEDLDDRAAKRRKIPVSLCSCYLLLPPASVAALNRVEMCRGLFGCHRLSITQSR